MIFDEITPNVPVTEWCWDVCVEKLVIFYYFITNHLFSSWLSFVCILKLLNLDSFIRSLDYNYFYTEWSTLSRVKSEKKRDEWEISDGKGS